MIIESVVGLGILAIIFALLIAYVSKKFHVEVDPKIDEVTKALPNFNCGACGFANCEAFAEAVVNGKAPVDGCIVGAQETADKVAEIMGKEASKVEKKVAKVLCEGNSNNCGLKFDYKGIKTCKASSLVSQGPKNCSYGCIGYGDCFNACNYDAIRIKDGIAVIDKNKCIGDGACVPACPKSIIEMIPKKNRIHVFCSSKDNAKDSAKRCKVSCIACRLCEKACNFDAIHVNDNLAKIDYSKCTECGACVKACPRKIIITEPTSQT